MPLQQVEAPTGAGLQVLCPNCSRMHDAEEYAPTCKRCGEKMEASKPSKGMDMAEPPHKA